tara:strand:+ start:418941 stop:419228 length:288 start_codon:yes stop_codon:yes gene_type:complete
MNTHIITEALIQGLQVSKIFKTDTTETLLITLEKDKLFPKHTSPKEAMLVVLEGSINFYIEGKTIELNQNNTYSFQKNVEHHVVANENSKFLIIR